MPHYKDGTASKEGDLVRGVSYNLGGRVIVGTVLEIIPGSDTCNIRVAFASVEDHESAKLNGDGVIFQRSYGKPRAVIRAGYDYGETKAFEKIG